MRRYCEDAFPVPRYKPAMKRLRGSPAWMSATRLRVLVCGLGAGLLLPVGTLWSQPVAGTITDEDNHPLTGVHVLVDSLGMGTITDAVGEYSLPDLPRGAHTLSFRSVGYATSDHSITALGQRIELNVVLEVVVVELDEVTTSADGVEHDLTRAAASVTTLDPDDLNALRGQTLAETLSHLAGVTALTTGPSIAKPVIRGLHSQRLVVLNAGVPQEGQQWSGEHAPEIDPFAPVSIDVVRGAAGVEYGPGAIGGVIRLEPNPLPVESDLGGFVSLNAFSNNSQVALSVMIENGVGAIPGLGWRGQASMRKAGSARTPDYVIGNSGFEELNGSVTIGYEADRVLLRTHASLFSTELGLFSGAHIGNYDDLLRVIARGEPAVEYPFTFDIAAPKQTVRHMLFTMMADIYVRRGSKLKVQFGAQQNTRREFDAHRRFSETGQGPDFDLGLATQTLEIRYRAAPNESFFWAFGSSGMIQQNINAESGYLIPNFRAMSAGAYFQATWRRTPWTVETGLRGDHRWLEAYPRISRQSGFERRTHEWTGVSGVVGVIRRLGHTWSLAANLGTTWRPPGVNELYSFGVHHGTAQFEIGTASLGGERGRSLDLTLRHMGKITQLEISAFSNRMSGYIHLFPQQEPRVTIRGAFPSFQYMATDALLRGIDGLFSLEPRRWLHFDAQGSIVRGTDQEAEGPLIFMPANRLTLGMGFALFDSMIPGESDLEIEVTMVDRQGRYPKGIDYAEPPHGYTLFNFGYHLELSSGVHASLTVQNLFNAAYRDYLSRFRYYVDNPGRNVVLRLSIPIGNQQHHPHT